MSKKKKKPPIIQEPEEKEEGMYCRTCETHTMYEVGNVYLCDKCGNWCYSSS